MLFGFFLVGVGSGFSICLVATGHYVVGSMLVASTVFVLGYTLYDAWQEHMKYMERITLSLNRLVEQGRNAALREGDPGHSEF